MTIPEPNKILVPFADSGLKNSIPANANNTTGKAGFDKGFPERTMLPKVSGGIPPSGMDFNGILYDITSAIRYMQAGGKPTYDAAFAAAIGGYPSGAVLIGDDGVSVFQNAVAGNETDPNSGGAGWTRPDLQAMEMYRRSYAEAGYNVVGTFQEGFTYVNANDVGIDLATGKGYTGPAGPIDAGTNPASGGFVDRSVTGGQFTYAALRAYSGNGSFSLSVVGRSNIFDGGHGVFYRSNSTLPDDDGFVLRDALDRAWLRYVPAESPYDPKWWGAKADDVTYDDAALQKAIDISKRDRKSTIIHRHATSRPLVIYSRTSLVNPNRNGVIRKAVAGKLQLPPAPTLSPNGDGSDSWNKDAAIIVYHDNSEWASNWLIDGVDVYNVPYTTEDTYCIYAPRAFKFKICNQSWYRATFGLYGHNWFMYELDAITTFENTMNRGIRLTDSTGGFVQATTGKVNRFWANGGGGISLKNAVQHTLTTVAFEKMANGAISLNGCYVDISGLDTENVGSTGGIVYMTGQSRVNISGWTDATGVVPGTLAQAHLWVDGQSSCEVHSSATTNNGNQINYGVIARDSSRVILNNSTFLGANPTQIQSGASIETVFGSLRKFETEFGEYRLPISGKRLGLPTGGQIDTGLRGSVSATASTLGAPAIIASVTSVDNGLARVRFYDKDGVEQNGPYDVMWTAIRI